MENGLDIKKKSRRITRYFFLHIFSLAFGLVGVAQALPANEPTVLIELFLSSDRKGEIDRIQTVFSEDSNIRLKTQFYPMGKAPLNIAVGRGVPASVARLAIQVAKKYNGGVHYVLPDFLYPLNYIAIGASHFSEENHVRIGPADLEALSDPAYTTEAWHRLYQTLIERSPRFQKK